MRKLELRMYGMVPYQLSGIQKGIQFMHAATEFMNIDLELYKEWANNHKTVVILNGGTTNFENGTLNSHLDELIKSGIKVSSFYEPDLGNQLTGIAFIVDERVFGKRDGKYTTLEFEDWLRENPNPFITINPTNESHLIHVRDMCKNGNRELRSIYDKWVEYMGGEKNVFLRNYLKNLKLA